MIVILNCTAGTARSREETPEGLRAVLRDRGVDAEVWCADPHCGMAKLAQRAVESGSDPIVAGGGDGTINAVAGALVGTGRRLGVLPLGTLNHFAKDCGIPVRLEGAIDLLKAGNERRVDLAEVNGRYFLNNSSLGLYPRIVRHRDQQRERLGRGKWPAFAWALLSALRVCPSLGLSITVDGQPSITRTPFFFVGNNNYHMEGLRIGARDSLEGGVLGVYFARAYGRWGIFTLALRSMIGRVRQAKNFEVLSAESVRVQTKKPAVDVSADGEVHRMETPLQYRIHPRALPIIGAPLPT